MENQQQFDMLDIISIFSFLLGYENLIENREQSRHNDVKYANNKQAKYLIEKLTKKFEEQNELLNKIYNEIQNN